MKAPHETKYVGGHLTHVPDLNADNDNTLTDGSNRGRSKHMGEVPCSREERLSTERLVSSSQTDA